LLGNPCRRHSKQGNADVAQSFAFHRESKCKYPPAGMLMAEPKGSPGC
jgi:hypothetical protein